MRRHPLSSHFLLAYLAWLWEVPAYAWLHNPLMSVSFLGAVLANFAFNFFGAGLVEEPRWLRGPRLQDAWSLGWLGSLKICPTMRFGEWGL